MGNCLLVLEVAPQPILAVLHWPTGPEHNCAEHSAQPWWADLPLKAHQLRQAESGGDGIISILLKLKEINYTQEVWGRTDYQI